MTLAMVALSRIEQMYIKPPKKPEPEEYNLTPEQYTFIKNEFNQIRSKTHKIIYLPHVITFIAALYIFKTFKKVDGLLILVLIAIIFTLINRTCEYLKEKYIDYRISRMAGHENFRVYDDALLSYSIEKDRYDKQQEQQRLKKEREIKRRQHEYWMSLDPYEFEKEIALLFKKLGYKAHVTKGSGDGGIDIFLEKEGQKGIVQCKRFKNKVGPAPIRDLYGTMKAGNHTFGFFVCPSGFSHKAYEFSKGKNLKLIGLKQIMEMAE